jgi:molybdate transport system substrate-binding protein
MTAVNLTGRSLETGHWCSARDRAVLVVVFLASQFTTLPARAADVVVSAATSLTGAFTEIGKVYQKVTPGTHVLFNFGASGQLLQQISRGAPADVFASADLETMDRAEKEKLIVRSSRVNFAANKLLLIVPHNSPLKVSSLQDLATPHVQRWLSQRAASLVVRNPA